MEYGPFKEDGVLEGVVIKVGGKGETVPIWLQDNQQVHRCGARRPLARKIAKHYDRGIMRVKGTGTWMRLANGAWLMKSFEIRDFELLDEAPLTEVINRLQGIEGADWGDDPVGDLMRLRSGDGLN